MILRAQLPSQAKQTNKSGSEDDSAHIFATPGGSVGSNFDDDEALCRRRAAFGGVNGI